MCKGHCWKAVFFSTECSLSLLKKCRAQHSLNRNTQFFVRELRRGGKLPIPNLSWICQAVPETCAFKVRLISFVFFFSFFLQHFSNCFNSSVLGWIVLKFRALWENIRTYPRFNFCSNGMKKHRVIIDFLNFQMRFLSYLQVKLLA